MRIGSDDLRGALTGSFVHEWVADLYFDGERRLQRVPITNPRFQERGLAKVQQSGSCVVEWTDEFATSLSPRYIDDPLAPFGAQLHVYSDVSAGPLDERVEYGWFLITDVPSARDERMRWRAEWLTVGSTVQLDLAELLDGIAQESFDVPTAPRSLTSAWNEVGRITRLPLARTVPDAPIPRSVKYQDNRLDATYDLFSVVLDAIPHMTGDGVLAARANSWTPVVDIVPLGCVVSAAAAMSSAQVYNRVAVRATGSDGDGILAVAEIEDGPLRVRNSNGSRSPFGMRTKYLSSELVSTRFAAQKWANSELAKVSRYRAAAAQIETTFNPLWERGDVLLVERPDEWWRVRVVDIDRSRRGTQSLTVEVAERIVKVDEDPPPIYVPTAGLYPGDDTFPGDDVFPGG